MVYEAAADTRVWLNKAIREATRPAAGRIGSGCRRRLRRRCGSPDRISPLRPKQMGVGRSLTLMASTRTWPHFGA